MKNIQCYFEENNISHIDYKDVATLSEFINPHGRILNTKRTNVCSKHQRKLAQSIKRARIMGFMPFVER